MRSVLLYGTDTDTNLSGKDANFFPYKTSDKAIGNTSSSWADLAASAHGVQA
jgi:hypothetical protein